MHGRLGQRGLLEVGRGVYGSACFRRRRWIESEKSSFDKGGEYHSPCPGCGGKDRFIIWDKLNRYWCRQCNRKGDEIQYCRDFRGLSYLEACQKSCIAPKSFTGVSLLPAKRFAFQFVPQVAKTPSAKWRRQAEAFTRYCHEQVKNNPLALDFFLRRGLSEESNRKISLGLEPQFSLDRPQPLGNRI